MNSRGSLLIAGLWAMSIFSVMTTSLTFNASQNALMIKREIEDFKARQAFLSGVHYTARLMEEDPFPHEDSPSDAWFGAVKLQKPFSDKMEIRVQDEESKVNLNAMPEAFLTAFFKAFEEDVLPLKGSRKNYVKGISKLRNEKRIQSLEELLLMEDFQAADLEPLRPFVTVYPDAEFLNINTAKPVILKALLNYLSGDHGAKQLLLARLEEDQQAQAFWTSQDLRPEIFAEKLKLPKTPVFLGLAQEFLQRITTDSETFSLQINLMNGRQASAVIRYRAGQIRPEVLGWHES